MGGGETGRPQPKTLLHGRQLITRPSAAVRPRVTHVRQIRQIDMYCNHITICLQSGITSGNHIGYLTAAEGREYSQPSTADFVSRGTD